MDVLNAKCRLQQGCDLLHVNDFMFGGSPCGGVKYLDVTYDCIAGNHGLTNTYV